MAVLWGHSPSMDLQQQMEESAPSSVTDQHNVNILVAGAGDVRHLIRTLAQGYRHTAGRRLHLYVVEPDMEAAARQLLLLCLSLEPAEVLSPAQKSRIFLELHGNTLVRPCALQYVQHKAEQLLYMVTDPSYLRGRLPLVSLDQLKYKERDYLECTYKFWKNTTPQEFDIVNLWDVRLRNTLGVRYDARQGQFDWDYHMKLNCSLEGGTPITLQEYISWRDTGVAFRWPGSSECTEINVTLGSGILGQHSFRNCQYLGDQLTGPYIGFGIDCEDEYMLRKYNNKFVKTATDVSERNVMRLMNEIAYRKPFDVDPPFDDCASAAPLVREDPPPLRRSDTADSGASMFSGREDFSSLTVEDVNIVFLSPGTLSDERPNPRLRGLFHVISVGQSVLPASLNKSLLGMAADEALLLLEGRKFVVGPRRCQREEFNELMLEAATDLRLEPIPPDAEYEPANQHLMKYIVRKSR